MTDILLPFVPPEICALLSLRSHQWWVKRLVVRRQGVINIAPLTDIPRIPDGLKPGSSLPASSATGNRAPSWRHEVALSNLALEIIDGLPRFVDENYVFASTRNPNKPVAGLAYAKQKVVDHMGSSTPWRLHDLRRTPTTGMARLGVAPHIADKILNHTGGVIQGVAAVYNKFAYLDERRDALQRRGEFVAQLVGANVVAMRS